MDSLRMLISATRRHYKKEGRVYLPWRRIRDPYKILVSEIMLQQTQVDRVVPFYNAFIKKFPNTRILARAQLPEVLRLWQGLGYNRRAKMLRDAARAIEEKHGGKFPRNIEDIDALPGVGPYTARAVAAFAFNKPEVFIETNIRTVFIHHCFVNRRVVGDTEILPLVERALARSKMQPRYFYAGLMDYGSYLKRFGIRLNNRSKHYTKQSKFEGSRRQLRGQILKLLLEKPRTEVALVKESGRTALEVREELARLIMENMISFRDKNLFLAK